ncbi:MAG TPA: histidinol-phosphatase, partial [candidate division Zixibacteria bacterium]
LIGYEIHDQRNQNHFLAFNVNEVLPGELSAQEYVSAIRKLGGLGIIAHPDEIRETPKFPPYPWTAWKVEGFDGIEIWNQMSEWMEGIAYANRFRLFTSPRRFLTSPTPKTLKIWDERNKQRKVCGICGVDAHAHPFRLGPFKLVIFPYKVQFQSLRLHLLLKESLSSDNLLAKKQVIDSIRECHAFISNYRQGDARGFSFSAQNQNQSAGMGEEISSSHSVLFKVGMPQRCKIRLVNNGGIVKEDTGKTLEYSTTAPGNYRVEAYKGKKGWIFSNHIRVVISTAEVHT